MSTLRYAAAFALALASAGCIANNLAVSCDGPGCTAAPDGGASVDATSGCNADRDCAGETPRCDTSTRTCVVCLPAQDNCGSGKRCVLQGNTYACTSTCSTAADCQHDGGAFMIPLTCCSGVCVATSSDVANCGACGVVCPTPTHGTPNCSGSLCGIAACDPGFADCDHNTFTGCETPTTADPSNCGACGTRCIAAPNATPVCAAGMCANTCVPGAGDCDGDVTNGCETDLTSNNSHCGTCATVCPMANNAVLACENGACSKLTCKFGFDNCDQTSSNGCESSLLAPTSCGACGIVCPTPPNATAGCNVGVCGVGQCAPNFGDCNRIASDGCEKSLAADPNNCGACNVICAPAHATGACLGGTCGVVSCTAGYHDCDGNAANGCESQLNDPANCGACGMACPAHDNTVPICSNGVCGSVCVSGFADCNANVADGCEANLASATTCGTCTNACAAVPQGTPACFGGTCVVGACNIGYANCNGLPVDGCEQSVVSDPNNCGGCGMRCAAANAATACLNGGCGILQCSQPYSDCDGAYANGCEANLQTDASNCGACGRGCGVGLICVAGACTCSQCQIPNASATCMNNACMFQACNQGYANCDSNLANGCEANTNTDVRNCGGCGVVCPANQFCVSGACKTAPRCPNILFVFDESGSEASTPDGSGVGMTKLEVEIAALTNALNLYPNAAPYGLEIFSSLGGNDPVCYSDTSIATLPAAGTAAAIKAQIAPLQPTYNSNVGEAIMRAASVLTDPSRDNVVFIITDGAPNCNLIDMQTTGTYTLSTVTAAAAQNPPVKTVVVGFDQAGDGPPELLNQMASAGLEPQPGCNSGTLPCYYPASVQSVQTALERLLFVQNGVPQCSP